MRRIDIRLSRMLGTSIASLAGFTSTPASMSPTP